MKNGLGLSGVPVDNVMMPEALQRIEDMIRKGGMHQVATANVDFLVNATKDDEFRRVMCNCDLVVADGMPIVWASRLFGLPLNERVAGADLVPQLVRLSGEKGYTIFLLGASPEVAEAAERQMKVLSPGVRVVGRLSPPIRPLEDFDNEPILAEIERANPDILLVAFGSPKQEKWIDQNRHRLNVPVCIGIGGTLDFLAGSVRRAPMWMQKSGMEWLFRILVDPYRLAPRYFADGVWMIRYFFVQLALQQALRRREETLDLTVDSIGSVKIFGISGVMAGAGLAKIDKALSPAVLSGEPVVLDLAGTSHIGADGLWLLTKLLRRATERGSEVWLAGLSRAVARQIRAAHFDGLFQCAPSAINAARHASRGRLQVNIEMGDRWAVCRIAGEVPAAARATLEEICCLIREANDHFEFDASGMAEFDEGSLANAMKHPGKLAYPEAAARTSIVGAA